jgi:hypothetical protein
VLHFQHLQQLLEEGHPPSFLRIRQSMRHLSKVMCDEPRGFSPATVDSRWMEMGGSRELSHRRKWSLVEGGQDGFIGIVDRLSIVGIRGFPSRKGKFRFTKGGHNWALPNDIGPSVATILL